MADVFISYARNDRSRAQKLVRVFKRQGWSVWWDRDLIGGEAYDDVIEQALAEARCVVVLWSEHSVGSHWVRAEAAEGREREALVPVLLDEVKLPLEFRRLQTISFVGADGPDDDPVEQLVQSVTGVLARAASGADAEPMRISCPACGRVNVAHPRLAGRTGKCRGCGGAITVPGSPVSGAPSRSEPPASRPSRRLVPGLVGGALLVAGAAWFLGPEAELPEGPGTEETGDEVTLEESAADTVDAAPTAEQARLAELHDELDQLEAADLAQTFTPILERCEEIITTLAPSDPRALSALVGLQQRATGDAERLAAVADVQRWRDAPTGSATRFEQALSSATAALSVLDVDAARSARDDAAAILSPARELTALEPRILDATSRLDAGRALLERLPTLTDPHRLDTELSAGRDLQATDEVLAEALDLGPVLDTQEERLASIRAQDRLAWQALLARWSAREPSGLETVADTAEVLRETDALLARLPEDERRRAVDALGTGLHGHVVRLTSAATDIESRLADSERWTAVATELTGEGLRSAAEDAGAALLVTVVQQLRSEEDEARLAALIRAAASPHRITPAPELSSATTLAIARLDIEVSTPEEAATRLAQLDAWFPTALSGPADEALGTIRGSLQAVILAEEQRLGARLAKGDKELEDDDLSGARGTFGKLQRDLPSDSRFGILARLRLVDVDYADYVAQYSGRRKVSHNFTPNEDLDDAYTALLEDRPPAIDPDGVSSHAHAVARLAFLASDRRDLHAVLYKLRGLKTNLLGRDEASDERDAWLERLEQDFPGDANAQGVPLVDVVRTGFSKADAELARQLR